MSDICKYVNKITILYGVVFCQGGVDQITFIAKYIIVNSAFISNLSLKPEYSVLGKRDEDFFNRSESKTNTEQDLYVLSNGKSMRNIEQFIPGSKKRKQGLISKLPVFDSYGKIAGVIGSFVDISERVHAEHRRQLLEKVINHADDIFWIAKHNERKNDFKYLFVSDAVKNIYGIDDKQIEKLVPFEKDTGKTSAEELKLLKTESFPYERISRITRTDNKQRIINRKFFKLRK